MEDSFTMSLLSEQSPQKHRLNTPRLNRALRGTRSRGSTMITTRFLSQD